MTVSIKLAFALPTFFSSAFNAFMGLHLFSYWVDELLIAPQRLSIISSFNSSIGLFTDLFMGVLVDRLGGKGRRILLYFGGIGVGLCNVALFLPSGNLLSISAVVGLRALIPLSMAYNSVGTELKATRDELYSWHHSFSLVGGLVGGGALPIMSIIMSSSSYKYAAFACVCSIGLSLSQAFLAWTFGRELKGGKQAEEDDIWLVPGLKHAIKSPPFMILLSLYAFDALRGLLTVGLFPLYVSHVVWLKGSVYEWWISAYSMTMTLVAAASAPIWARISRKFGRKRAWLIGNVIGLPIGVFMWLSVGKGDQWIYLFWIFMIAITSVGPGFYHQSLRAAVIDLDELRTGQHRAGSFSSFWSIVPRWIGLPGAAVAFSIIGRAGFKSGVETQTDHVVSMINFLAALCPSLTGIGSVWIMTRLPLNDDVCDRITAGLKLHANGEDAIDPLTGAVINPHVTTMSLDKHMSHFSTDELASMGIREGIVNAKTSALALRKSRMELLCEVVSGVVSGVCVLMFFFNSSVEGRELIAVVSLLLASVGVLGCAVFDRRRVAAMTISNVKIKSL